MVVMTQISSEDVQRLAQLSSLQLSDDEQKNLREDIERILGYIEQLSSLDTHELTPTYQVTDRHNVWQDDIVADHAVSREDLLALAPSQHNHSVKVPKVL